MNCARVPLVGLFLALATSAFAQTTLGSVVRPWPGGVVPIQFSPAITSEWRAMVFEACANWAAYADITCVERTTELAYVRIEAGPGECSAQYGAPLAGWTVWNMNPAGCWFERTVNHELGHVLGLLHEHQRADRDEYVDVHLDRVSASMRPSFDRMAFYRDVGPYDFLSVMHYRDFSATSYDRGPSIEPKPAYASYAGRLGASDRPTEWDGAAVAAIYGDPRPDSRPYLSIVQLGQPSVVTWSCDEPIVRWTLEAGTSPGASDLLRMDMGARGSASGTLPPGVPVFVRVVGSTVDGRTLTSNEVELLVPTTPVIRFVGIQDRTADIWFSTPSGQGVLHVFNALGREILRVPVSGAYVRGTNVAPGVYMLSLEHHGQWSPLWLVVVP